MGTSLGFWLVATALLLAALAFVLPTLLRARTAPTQRGSAQLNAALYREQLAELERDARLGLIGAADAERAGDELQRRLLEDVRGSVGASRVAHGRGVALGVAVLLPLAAVLLYLTLGTPQALTAGPLMAGAADGAAADASTLEQHLRSNPRDARGWVLLARAQAEAGAFLQAAQSYARAVDVSPNVARDPGVLCEFADALGMAQGGSLAGRPAELVSQALAIDGAHPLALEMAGSAAYEVGDYARAARHWLLLLPQLQTAPQRHAELAAAIARAQTKAKATATATADTMQHAGAAPVVR